MITALYVLGTHALGTAHFQYDPNHRPTNLRRLPKVWVERAEKYSRCGGRKEETSTDNTKLTRLPYLLSLNISLVK